MDGPHHNSVNPLYVGILGVISGSILVAFIHCIVVNCRHRSLETTTSPPRPPEMHRRPRVRVDRDFTARLSFPSTSSGSSSSGRSSIMLTVHKYSKEFKEGTCVVCLGKFEENEEVRIMPECAHVFHVSCIDMWLFSHTNCPLCRANATPRTQDVLLSIMNSTTVV
ncbi:RING-H2 finger protein ATL52-like [Cynara cardunculus var. scolymus]|uniref:RING-H2 finger protein ATL52-like n=1 Tax=Cynara cardunculus var. scolymus TaxID=59895 RepID=UPI000D6240E8|nr:RING-H2 finger protein ATL52-like [Cynara cardunculus var. scolymus]